MDSTSTPVPTNGHTQPLLAETLMEQPYETTFASRHIGPTQEDQLQMLQTLGLKSLEELIEKSVPDSIKNPELNIASALSESELLQRAKELVNKNKIFKSFIGQGYYGTHTPTVIQRNILENPGWYTAYTPYQAEISQGRMEALLNFQTMVCDLTGMELSNASLLDEGTALAEATLMAQTINGRKAQSNKVFVDEAIFGQSLEVLNTRTEAVGIEWVTGRAEDFDFAANPVFAALIQYPNSEGQIIDHSQFVKRAHENNSMVIVSADVLSLALLTPPGEWGADIVVGSTQRFGVPMGFGGPHAAFLATKKAYQRNIPGRLIGVSKDKFDTPALRLALQTREQHIRREKATSNICTAQVLLAVMASMYAVYHGPEGLKRIASETHEKALRIAIGLQTLGYEVKHQQFFDTVAVTINSLELYDDILARTEKKKINLNVRREDLILISVDETTSDADINNLLDCFPVQTSLSKTVPNLELGINEGLLRTSEPLKHPIFSRFHSETEMLRYIHSLETKDISLTRSMIALGSCTMKLNSTTEMMPVTWEGFSNIHPFAPSDQTEGYLELINELRKDLAEITGYADISLQPNAGSQGEYAGLLVIKKYHASIGQAHRNICLIPQSAHGTNPASAALAGLTVVGVRCDENGNIDVAHLRELAQTHSDNLSSLMITYPSTHGVFEEEICEICEIIHDQGGQVYLDGANLNALVGVAKPGVFGSDVSHLNLHKTFCIPHGGGGPGVGPIGVAEHLKPFLPQHSEVTNAGPQTGIGAVSAAPWGSASILPISWAYCKMMGSEGLRKATHVAILSGNYIAKRLEGHFPILYTGKNGFVAHECIIDLRPFKAEAGVEVNDIAKRLIDFGFHSPTMSWPVPGTLMIEPTESESKEEIDRFCDAMITIRAEIQEIIDGKQHRENNVIVNAPHVANELILANWDKPYSAQKAFYPANWVQTNKYWPPVARIDNAYGDRNLVCTCPSVSDFDDSLN